MNTRLQVEHPVTEMVTGVDIVAEQIRDRRQLPLIARARTRCGGPATPSSAGSTPRTPSGDFRPDPGMVTGVRAAGRCEGVRVDTHVASGYRIPPFYDSMIAKLIVHGADRADGDPAGRERPSTAFRIEGVKTTIPLHRLHPRRPGLPRRPLRHPAGSSGWLAGEGQLVMAKVILHPLGGPLENVRSTRRRRGATSSTWGGSSPSSTGRAARSAPAGASRTSSGSTPRAS